MKRFKNILYVNEPGTETTSSSKRAVQLALKNQALLTLCDVREELPRSLPTMEKTLNQLHEKELKSLAGKIAVDGLTIKMRMLTGTPFVEIIKEVKRGGYDLVIKSAEGKGSLHNSIFGSTDMYLMRKCPCPVWIMKPSKNKKYTRILAAVDMDAEVPTNAELNNIILDLAISQARQDNSELHIVHAWHFPHEDLFRSKRAPQLKSEIDQLVSQVRKERKAELDSLLEAYPVPDIVTRVHLLKGKPNLIIPNIARQMQVELIVMGTIARTGIPGFFIGNTAEKILANVDCSVLTVKPESFKTPVSV